MKITESSYEVRQTSAIFSNLIAIFLVKAVWKAIELPNLSKELSLERCGGWVRIENSFPETTSRKLFETNSSFQAK